MEEWMFTGDETRDAALTLAYEYLIHVTKIPYFMNEKYGEFLGTVRERLVEPPFNRTDVKWVGKQSFYIYFYMIVRLFTVYLPRHCLVQKRSTFIYLVI